MSIGYMSLSVKVKKWESKSPPKHILIIRLQAIGDVVITLPFVQQLKNQYPEAKIDFLTRKTQVTLLQYIEAIDKVIPFTNKTTRYGQLAGTVQAITKLLPAHYDVVLDLQTNRFSRLIRQVLFPKSFAEFERFTPFTAADRNWQALTESGLLEKRQHPTLTLKSKGQEFEILKNNNWDGTKDLILLNPAGAFKSRNWTLDNYVYFAQKWLQTHSNTQFIVLGTEKIKDKSDYLKNKLGENLINLVEKTTLTEAMLVISKCRIILTEDSGLMHMAWALKVPTISLIGSTDKNRSSQHGEHMVNLYSDDLPCGNCMRPTCQFGEIPFCLSRYTPEYIIGLAEKLLLQHE